VNVKEMGYKSPASGNLAKQRRLLPATMAAEGAGEDGSGGHQVWLLGSNIVLDSWS